MRPITYRLLTLIVLLLVTALARTESTVADSSTALAADFSIKSSSQCADEGRDTLLLVQLAAVKTFKIPTTVALNSSKNSTSEIHGAVPLRGHPAAATMSASFVRLFSGRAAELGKSRSLGPAVEATPATGECRILSDTFDFAMQGLLGAICMSSLVLKWWLEVPRRLLFVFSLDTSKQIFGALWVHILNMCFAMILQLRNSTLPADECAWYFTNFLIDTTFGLVLNFTLLRITERRFGYSSGNYWREPEEQGGAKTLDKGIWFKQLMIYVAIVAVSKTVVVFVMLVIPGIMSSFGVIGTTWIENVDARLFFVMVIVPLVMDTFFFWITDEFIKDGECGEPESAPGTGVESACKPT